MFSTPNCSLADFREQEKKNMIIQKMWLQAVLTKLHFLHCCFDIVAWFAEKSHALILNRLNKYVAKVLEMPKSSPCCIFHRVNQDCLRTVFLSSNMVSSIRRARSIAFAIVFQFHSQGKNYWVQHCFWALTFVFCSHHLGAKWKVIHWEAYLGEDTSYAWLWWWWWEGGLSRKGSQEASFLLSFEREIKHNAPRVSWPPMLTYTGGRYRSVLD